MTERYNSRMSARDYQPDSSAYRSKERSPPLRDSPRGRGEGGSGEGGGVVAKDDFRAQRDCTLEVCREFLKKRCRRSELECRYAHPPTHVEIRDGRVTCCFDYNKGRCTRYRPPCRFLHPPPHLMPEGMAPPAQASLEALRGIIPPHLIRMIFDYMSGSRGVDRGGSRRTTERLDKIEACREFRKGRCTRDACRYAHPPPDMRLDVDSCVTACMDYVTHDCTRDKCRYFHPPEHILQRIQDALGMRTSAVVGSRRRDSHDESRELGGSDYWGERGRELMRGVDMERGREKERVGGGLKRSHSAHETVTKRLKLY